MAAPVREIVDHELAKPVDPRVADMAAAIAERYGEASRAVLFYGSCLRERELGGLMLDFYVIVSTYREAYGRGWLAFANRLVPPNVFPFEHRGLVAKYAVLSEADLARECGPKARSVSVWARFAQPARLVWAKDGAARGRTVAAVASAAPTLFALTRPTMTAGPDDPIQVFRAGFALTYGAELRAERRDRSVDIVSADADYYRRLGAAVLAAASARELRISSRRPESPAGRSALRDSGRRSTAKRADSPDGKRIVTSHDGPAEQICSDATSSSQSVRAAGAGRTVRSGARRCRSAAWPRSAVSARARRGRSRASALSVRLSVSAMSSSPPAVSAW